jgi:FeS assembly SUF system protein
MFSRLIRLGKTEEPEPRPAPAPAPAAEPQAASEAEPLHATPPPAAGSLEEQVIAAIRTCYDPEIPVNIFELGLIYGVDVAPDRSVTVTMTLTTPNCPAAQSLPGDVQAKVAAVAGVTDARVNLTFDPPWDMSRMSEAARLELGFL